MYNPFTWRHYPRHDWMTLGASSKKQNYYLTYCTRAKQLLIIDRCHWGGEDQIKLSYYVLCTESPPDKILPGSRNTCIYSIIPSQRAATRWLVAVVTVSATFTIDDDDDDDDAQCLHKAQHVSATEFKRTQPLREFQVHFSPWSELITMIGLIKTLTNQWRFWYRYINVYIYVHAEVILSIFCTPSQIRYHIMQLYC